MFEQQSTKKPGVESGEQHSVAESDNTAPSTPELGRKWLVPNNDNRVSKLIKKTAEEQSAEIGDRLKETLAFEVLKEQVSNGTDNMPEGVKIFLAHSKNSDSKYNDEYSEALSGDSHPLYYGKAREWVEFSINTLMCDKSIPWPVKARMFYELGDTCGSKLGYEIVNILKNLIDEDEEYITSQALEALTQMFTNPIFEFLIDEDNQTGLGTLIIKNNIRYLSENTNSYFIKLRCDRYLAYIDSLKEEGRNNNNEFDDTNNWEKTFGNSGYSELFYLSPGIQAEINGFDTIFIRNKETEKLEELKSSNLTDLPLSAAETNLALFNFQFMSRPYIRKHLHKEFKVDISEMTLKEQFFFLSYLKKTSLDDINTLKHFTSLYGVEGVRTFLSLERGDESLGDSIVAFGQHDEVAGTVFKYYGELLDSAERAEALVKEVSDCEGEACTELASQVRENILNRAQKDLEKAVRSHDPSEVAAQIENYVAAAKEYVALLQEVGAGKIESVSPETLSEEDRRRMRNLLQANYRKAYPETENHAFKLAIAGSLEKSFNNPDTSFRLLRDNGKIVSYNRFDTVSDFNGREVSYFGSFNADPAYSGVGGVMLEETIKNQLEGGVPMMAHCDPTKAITRKYIEDGFVATQCYELAGKPSFEIWRSKTSSSELKSKSKTVEEILGSTDISNSITVREESAAEEFPELKSGKALTRYFTHQGKVYLVFEVLPNSLSETFTPPQAQNKEAA